MNKLYIIKSKKSGRIQGRQSRMSKVRATSTTSMEDVLSEKRRELIRQSAWRDNEDSNARKALSSLVIRSNEEIDETYQNAVKTFDSKCQEVLGKDVGPEKVKDLNSIVSSYISCIDKKEPTYAQRLYSNEEKIVSYKAENIVAQFDLKSMLEMLRNAIALRNAVGSFEPTAKGLLQLVLDALKVLLELNQLSTVEFTRDSIQGKVLETTLIKTNWGRDFVDLEELAKAIAADDPNTDVIEIENMILEVFEKKYRILDVTDGRVKFVESISF